MHPSIENFLPTAQAIERLLYPHAEVVIHDIASNTIAAIFNAFSKRNVGDEALLTQADIPSLDDCTGPYPKTNWDGRQLKSVSSIIRDDEKNAVGLLCINMDVSKLQLCQQFLTQFLHQDQLSDQPAALFSDDWYERINQYVTQYLQDKLLTLDSINRSEKQQLVAHLHDAGAFTAKNAANYIANVLNISRATVYKYLNHKDKL